MDSAQQLLFGEFPRAVGVTTPDWQDMELRQFLVHSELEFDGVIDEVAGDRNLYSSISAYIPSKSDGEFAGCAVQADKVSFDFDSPAKAEPDDYPNTDPDEKPNWEHPLIPERASDKDVIAKMRTDSEIREAVLGDVCFQARQLAQTCLDENIPLLGVFSGFGLHVHLLHEPTMSRPSDKLLSTCNKWTTELNLALADERASGRPFRIMRIPNVERVDHSGDSPVSTGIYTVPLRAGELAEIRPGELLDLARQPRPSIGSEPRSRPEMKVHEDYLGPGWDEGAGQEKMRPIPDESVDDELAQVIIKDIVQMPCVYERAFGRNPPNDVRVKLGIMLLNADYTPETATDLIGRLGWVDFDRDTTLYQLRKLKESGKGDWSCKTMQAKGLCTRADDKQACPTYGYEGGNKPW